VAGRLGELTVVSTFSRHFRHNQAAITAGLFSADWRTLCVTMEFRPASNPPALTSPRLVAKWRAGRPTSSKPRSRCPVQRESFRARPVQARATNGPFPAYYRSCRCWLLGHGTSPFDAGETSAGSSSRVGVRRSVASMPGARSIHAREWSHGSGFTPRVASVDVFQFSSKPTFAPRSVTRHTKYSFQAE